MTLAPQTDLAVWTGRPRYEGANIRTWIGFKHFVYLVEDAVLAWFRDQGHGARALFHDHGLGLELVDCSVQLPAVLEVDDDVRAELTPRAGGKFDVQLTVWRDGAQVVVLRGKITVALVREITADAHAPAPEFLADLVTDEIASIGGDLPVVGTVAESVDGFLWSWRAPYFYCHFADRVQHSGYVRALEEVVDRFLADRGISVGRMLTERFWIPVVSRARIRLTGAAHMEETVHTVFKVTDILRGVMFDATMDCYVRRGDVLVHVATAKILHGYAISRGDQAGQLAEFDAEVVAALLGERR